MNILLTRISTFSDWLPVLAGIIMFRKLPFVFRVLLVYYLYAALSDAFYMYAWTMYKITLSVPFELIEAVVYSILFIPLLLSNKKKKAVIFITSLAVIFILTTFFSDLGNRANMLFLIPKHILLIIIAGLLIFRTNTQLNVKLFRNGFFWIGAGMLIYFSLSLLVLTIFRIFAIDKTSSLLILWNIQSFDNITANTLYAVGFLLNISQKKLL